MFLNDHDSETSQKRQDKLRDKTSDSAEQGAGERSFKKIQRFPERCRRSGSIEKRMTTSPQDPENLETSLTAEEEDLMVFERKKFKKTVDEIDLALESEIDNLCPQKV